MYSQNMASSTTTANVGVGHKVGYYNVTGTGNTWLGYQAGQGASGNSNSNNVGIGYLALGNINRNSEHYSRFLCR